MKTMRTMGIIREDMVGGELTIVFDNCSGQNKNNTILKLLVFLVELKYFKKVQLLFLIVGHTKNACDHLFNALKNLYRQENIYTFPQLLTRLDKSDKVTVTESVEVIFFDWDSLLSLFYASYVKKVKQNHIFQVEICNWKGNQLQVDLHLSNRPEDTAVKHNAVKQGFLSRNDYPMAPIGLKTAIQNRYAYIRTNLERLLKPIIRPGMNPYKQVKLWKKWRPIIIIFSTGSSFFCRAPSPSSLSRSNLNLSFLISCILILFNSPLNAFLFFFSFFTRANTSGLGFW